MYWYGLTSDLKLASRGSLLHLVGLCWGLCYLMRSSVLLGLLAQADVHHMKEVLSELYLHLDVFQRPYSYRSGSLLSELSYVWCWMRWLF